MIYDIVVGLRKCRKDGKINTPGRGSHDGRVESR